jgi:hypothetical protein
VVSLNRICMVPQTRKASPRPRLWLMIDFTANVPLRPTRPEGNFETERHPSATRQENAPVAFPGRLGGILGMRPRLAPRAQGGVSQASGWPLWRGNCQRFRNNACRLLPPASQSYRGPQNVAHGVAVVFIYNLIVDFTTNLITQ